MANDKNNDRNITETDPVVNRQNYPSEKSNHEERYIISSGAMNRMFTLRYIWYEPVYQSNPFGQYLQTGWKERNNHVASLSIDLEKAKIKAKEICGYVPEVEAGELDDRKNPESVDWDKMPNGKYEGKKYFELPDDYLIWWIGNYYGSKSYKKTAERLVDYLANKIVFDLDKRQFIPIDYAVKKYNWFLEKQQRADDRLNQIKNCDYVGTVGERYKFGTVKLLKRICIEGNPTQWNSSGEFYIFIFVDESGSEIVYKSDSKFFSYDERFELVATIKQHKERTDRDGLVHKQTIIQRPKFTAINQ